VAWIVGSALYFNKGRVCLHSSHHIPADWLTLCHTCTHTGSSCAVSSSHPFLSQALVQCWEGSCGWLRTGGRAMMYTSHSQGPLSPLGAHHKQ
jgi:hypothetical protein